MTLETYITNNIEEIGETAWNAVSAGQSFQSYNWYRFGEKVMGNSRPPHVIISENGQVIARASFWRIDNESLATGLIATLIKRWPLLICRSPLFVAAPGWILPNPVRVDVLNEIVRMGRNLRRQEKCSLLLFDGLDAATAHIIPHAFRYSFGMPGTFLDARELQNFDQYVASLPYNARKDLRRHLRKIEECGITVTRHSTVPDLDEAENLYRKLEAHKGSERNPWIREMLANISMVHGTWFSARDARGQLLGGLTSYEDNGGQYVTQMARDTAPYAYFALVYESIRLGLEHNLHTLYWGTHSYSLKKRMGCSIIENDSVAILF
ncbi:MAG: GNAT family N-acetyltransferase [Chloroflexota bacterium]